MGSENVSAPTDYDVVPYVQMSFPARRPVTCTTN